MTGRMRLRYLQRIIFQLECSSRHKRIISSQLMHLDVIFGETGDTFCWERFPLADALVRVAFGTRPLTMDVAPFIRVPGFEHIATRCTSVGRELR